MALVSITEAARLVRRNRSTLYRDIERGRLSKTVTPEGETQIETSELLRTYGRLHANDDYAGDDQANDKFKIALLEERNRSLERALALEAELRRVKDQVTTELRARLADKDGVIKVLESKLLFLEYDQQVAAQESTAKNTPDTLQDRVPDAVRPAVPASEAPRTQTVGETGKAPSREVPKEPHAKVVKDPLESLRETLRDLPKQPDRAAPGPIPSATVPHLDEPLKEPQREPAKAPPRAPLSETIGRQIKAALDEVPKTLEKEPPREPEKPLPREAANDLPKQPASQPPIEHVHAEEMPGASRLRPPRPIPSEPISTTAQAHDTRKVIPRKRWWSRLFARH